MRSSSISISSQEWNQKTKQTKITFTIKNFGLNVDGDFSKIKINTNFNSKNLFESYINSENSPHEMTELKRCRPRTMHKMFIASKSSLRHLCETLYAIW